MKPQSITRYHQNPAATEGRETKRSKTGRVSPSKAGITKIIYEREYIEKNPPKPTMGYIVLTAALSSLFTMIMFLLYIATRDRDVWAFFLLWAINFAAGIIGGAGARILTGYYNNMNKTVKSQKVFNQQVVSSLLYTVVVWVGVYNYILLNYLDIYTTSIAEFFEYLVSREFLEVLAVLFGLKLFITLISDTASSKMVGVG